MEENQKLVGLYGILLNLVGSVEIVLSSFEYKGQSVSSIDKKLQFHPLFLDRRILYTGLTLLILGFIFQFIERIYDKIPDAYEPIIFRIFVVLFLFFSLGSILVIILLP